MFNNYEQFLSHNELFLLYNSRNKSTADIWFWHYVCFRLHPGAPHCCAVVAGQEPEIKTAQFVRWHLGKMATALYLQEIWNLVLFRWWADVADGGPPSPIHRWLSAGICARLSARDNPVITIPEHESIFYLSSFLHWAPAMIHRIFIHRGYHRGVSSHVRDITLSSVTVLSDRKSPAVVPIL